MSTPFSWPNLLIPIAECVFTRTSPQHNLILAARLLSGAHHHDPHPFPTLSPCTSFTLATTKEQDSCRAPEYAGSFDASFGASYTGVERSLPFSNDLPSDRPGQEEQLPVSWHRAFQSLNLEARALARLAQCISEERRSGDQRPYGETYPRASNILPPTPRRVGSNSRPHRRGSAHG